MTQACIIKLLIASYYPKEAITHRNEVVKEYINHVSHPLICLDIPNDLETDSKKLHWPKSKQLIKNLQFIRNPHQTWSK